MATTTFFAICLSLVLRASFSLPIGQTLDVKTVELSDGVREPVFTETSPVMLDLLLKPSEDVKHVQTVIEALPSAGVLRRKRQILRIRKQLCAQDMKEFHNRCYTKKRYEEILKENEVE